MFLDHDFDGYEVCLWGTKVDMELSDKFDNAYLIVYCHRSAGRPYILYRDIIPNENA